MRRFAALLSLFVLAGCAAPQGIATGVPPGPPVAPAVAPAPGVAGGGPLTLADYGRCTATDGPVENRIAGCTRLIRSGWLDAADLAVAYYARGRHYLEQREMMRSLADSDEAIRLNPSFVAAYTHKGVALTLLDRFDEALGAENKAIALDAHYAEAFNNRGLVWNAKGDYRRATADFSEAIRLEPGFAKAFANRGNAAFFLGNYQAAIADFEASQSLDRRPYPFIWIALAEYRDIAAQVAGEGPLEDRTAPTAAAGFDQGPWPLPIAALLLNLIDEDGLRQVARQGDWTRLPQRLCEVDYYAGQKYLTLRRPDAARPLLQQVMERCPPSGIEYQGARAELQRLGS